MFKILLSIFLSSAIAVPQPRPKAPANSIPTPTKPGTEWHYDLQEAESIAKLQHRLILLNFSGSDWCGPCIRMHKEIFDNADFHQVSDSTLVLLNADFPRLRKNQLPAKQQQANDAIADKYNPQGKFPLTILLTADGKPLRSWDGFPDGGEAAFTQQLQAAITAYRSVITADRNPIATNSITANR